MLRNIAVYCGAATGNLPVYQQAATDLGHFLVSHHMSLVYGGGGIGLMGVLANAVMKNGGVVHGVMPRQLAERGAADNQITDLTVVDNMAQRKQQMLDMADACIAMPGGPGTLEEIIEAYSWTRIGDNDNPCAFFNVNHYYDPLEALFDQMVDQQFLTSEHRSKIFFSEDLTQLFDFLSHYTPPTIRTNYEK